MGINKEVDIFLQIVYDGEKSLTKQLYLSRICIKYPK